MKPNEQDESIVDANSLTHDDLMDEYDKLAKKYLELRENNDCLNQKLHREISQTKVLQNTLNDCQSELDQINEKHEKIVQQIEKKNEEYRIKNQTLIMEKISLENQVDELSAKLEKISNELKEVRGYLAVKTIKPRVSDTYAKSLEIENEELRTTINNMQEQMQELVAKYAESSSRIEQLTEKLECVQENLETKKAELDDKIENLELLQEKNHELSSELTMLRNAAGPDENNRKGNSLFAEVDDQRQKMKKILQGERKHYMEMKKAHNAKEMEIRRLKRENLNIKSEIQACSNQINRSDQFSSNHNKIYITNLEVDKQNLETQLRRMEEKLVDMAKDQKMHWVETILTSATKESRELKDKYYVLLREKTTLADNHSKSLKELAKIRLYSIKLKMLLGRVVDKFKIIIDESLYLDLGLDEGIFESLKLQDYDIMDKSEYKQEDDSQSGMLNESTIILLGGREKLGTAIPNVEDNFGAKKQKFEEVEVKDFGFNTQKLQKMDEDVLWIDSQKSVEPMQVNNEPSTSNKVSFKDHEKENPVIHKPVVPVKSEVQSPLKTKSNTSSTSEVVEQVRKKPAFTIKRIVIPSKTSKPS